MCVGGGGGGWAVKGQKTTTIPIISNSSLYSYLLTTNVF